MERLMRAVMGKGILMLTAALALIFSAQVKAMASAPEASVIYVQTTDSRIMGIDRWKIDQMRVLLLLLEKQRGSNSFENPLLLEGLFLNARELGLLSAALDAVSRKEFENYFFGLAHKDGLDDKKIKYTLGEGQLRQLVSAAELVQATALSALCASYFLLPDMQKLLVPNIVSQSIELLQDRIIKAVPLDDGKSSYVGTMQRLICIGFSPDGTKVVVGGRDGNIQLYDALSGSLIHAFVNNNPARVQGLAFSPDGTKIVSVSMGLQDQIGMWDVATGTLIKAITAGEAFPVAVNFSPVDDNIIVVGYYVSVVSPIALWNISTNTVVKTIDKPAIDKITSVVFSPDGTKLLIAERDKWDSVALWDVASGNLIQKFTGDIGQVSSQSVKFSPDGTKIFAAGSKGIALWDMNNSHNSRYYSLLSYGFTQVASADVNFEDKRTLIMAHYSPDDPVRRVTRLAMFNDNGDIIFDKSFAGHRGGSVALSPNAQSIVYAAYDVSPAEDKYFYKWQLITEDEENVLKSMLNVNILQARLLYQLCSLRLSGLYLKLRWSTSDSELFMTLPDNVRDLLFKYILLPLCPRDKLLEESRGNECVIF